MTFFAELKRRNVVRVGIAYVIVGWLLAQIAEFAAENFGAPDWVLKIFVVFLVLGLPLALFFAWAFELTPEGLVLEKHVDRDKSITPQTGRKLDFIIIAVMAIALIYMVADKFIGKPDLEPTATMGKSIAVLPFVNMSDDKDYFADGLSEELLNLLVQIPDLKVAGRTSSFSFKDKNEDLRAVGDALGVSTVLEGSVRRSGDRLRITAQLINVEDGFHIWSNSYDRKMADIFDIQDDVAGAIATALKIHLAPGASPTAIRPTENMEAYGLYLEALAVYQESGDLLRPIELLDRALVLDPKIAIAHERKALFYWHAGGWLIDAPVSRELVFESAQAALTIDPDLVAAQMLLVSAGPDNWNWLKELSAIERAIREIPGDFAILNAFCYELTALGYFRESLKYAEQMIALDPLAAWGYARKAEALMGLDSRDEAFEAMDKAVEFGFRRVLYVRVFDLLMRREDDDAIRLMERVDTEYDYRPPLPDEISIQKFVESARDPINGGAYLENFVADAIRDATNSAEAIDPYFWYLTFGYLDHFFDAIDELTSKADTAWTNSDILEQGARYMKASGYAAHPRFLPLQEPWGAFDVWEERGPPDDCSKVDDKWVCK